MKSDSNTRWNRECSRSEFNASFATGYPARLNVEEAAKVLGFAVHDVPVLVAAKLLNPLGDPAPNSPKYFARVIVLERGNDAAWLHKATRVIAKYWQNKRARKRDVLTTR